jgi:precorrin-2 dehydrogenase/sirohydrochlorin ferrochelatase
MPRIHAMVPLALDPAAVPVAIAGRGAPALARLRALREGGAGQALLYSDQPTAELAAGAGASLRQHLPDAAAFERLRLLWIAGLPDPEAAALADAARRARVLVNVEDRPELCDFHNLAAIRRGDLLLTVSTGGKSPGLAARIRQKLGAEFGPEWSERVAAIGRDRTQWRRQRRSIPQLTTLTNDAIDRAGWLP